MSYDCMFYNCEHEFEEKYEVFEHLDEFHEWEEELNEAFRRPITACVRCGENKLVSLDDYLHHVLSMCPVTDESFLYAPRKQSFQRILERAMETAVSTANEGKGSGVLQPATDWHFECFVYDADEGRKRYNADFCAESKSSKQLILVSATVPWDKNISFTHYSSKQRMGGNEDVIRLQQEGWTIRIYSVEVGARGFPPKSLYVFFQDMGFNEREVEEYVQQARITAITKSQVLLE